MKEDLVEKKCVITGKPITNVGRIKDTKKARTTVDGVCTNMGLVHKEALETYHQAIKEAQRIIRERVKEQNSGPFRLQNHIDPKNNGVIRKGTREAIASLLANQ